MSGTGVLVRLYSALGGEVGDGPLRSLLEQYPVTLHGGSLQRAR